MMITDSIIIVPPFSRPLSYQWRHADITTWRRVSTFSHLPVYCGQWRRHNVPRRLIWRSSWPLVDSFKRSCQHRACAVTLSWSTVNIPRWVGRDGHTTVVEIDSPLVSWAYWNLPLPRSQPASRKQSVIVASWLQLSDFMREPMFQQWCASSRAVYIHSPPRQLPINRDGHSS